MTRQTFYRNLKKYTNANKTKWRIGSKHFGLEFGAKIRCDDGLYEDMCPLAYVANCKFGTNYGSHQPWSAADELDLSTEDAELIICSADRYTHCDKKFAGKKEVRAALLRATNLV